MTHPLDTKEPSAQFLMHDGLKGPESPVCVGGYGSSIVLDVYKGDKERSLSAVS